MKYIITLFVLSFSLFTAAQTHQEEVTKFQEELNKEYKDPIKSPLTKKDFRKFKGHDFFPINDELRVMANFQRMENAIPFLMKTTTDRLPTYEVYGVATFEIDGKEYRLNIYQSHSLRNTVQYKNYLFLPFTDLTNGEGTYTGGRFIGLEIPEADIIVIDFNKAYNPYCAYSPKYSCPIPPEENHLEIRVEAGVKYVK